MAAISNAVVVFSEDEAEMWNVGMFSDGWKDIRLVVTASHIMVYPRSRVRRFLGGEDDANAEQIIPLVQMEVVREAKHLDLDPPHRDDLVGKCALKIRTTSRNYQASLWTFSVSSKERRKALIDLLQKYLRTLRPRPFSAKANFNTMLGEMHVWNIGTFSDGWMHSRYELTTTGIEWYKVFFDVESTVPVGHVDYIEMTEVVDFDFSLASSTVSGYMPTKAEDVAGRNMLKIAFSSLSSQGRPPFHLLSFSTPEEREKIRKEILTRRAELSKEDDVTKATRSITSSDFFGNSKAEEKSKVLSPAKKKPARKEGGQIVLDEDDDYDNDDSVMVLSWKSKSAAALPPDPTAPATLGGSAGAPPPAQANAKPSPPAQANAKQAVPTSSATPTKAPAQKSAPAPDASRPPVAAPPFEPTPNLNSTSALASAELELWNAGVFSDGWMLVRYVLGPSAMEWFKVILKVQSRTPVGQIEYAAIGSIEPLDAQDAIAANSKFMPSTEAAVASRYMFIVRYKFPPKGQPNDFFVFSSVSKSFRDMLMAELSRKRSHSVRMAASLLDHGSGGHSDDALFSDKPPAPAPSSSNEPLLTILGKKLHLSSDSSGSGNAPPGLMRTSASSPMLANSAAADGGMQSSSSSSSLLDRLSSKMRDSPSASDLLNVFGNKDAAPQTVLVPQPAAAQQQPEKAQPAKKAAEAEAESEEEDEGENLAAELKGQRGTGGAQGGAQGGAKGGAQGGPLGGAKGGAQGGPLGGPVRGGAGMSATSVRSWKASLQEGGAAKGGAGGAAKGKAGTAAGGKPEKEKGEEEEEEEEEVQVEEGDEFELMMDQFDNNYDEDGEEIAGSPVVPNRFLMEHDDDDEHEKPSGVEIRWSEVDL